MRVATMVGSVALAVLTAMLPAAAPGSENDQARGAASPGAAGVGDPYYPRDGNGGYDVGHYDLAVSYRPGTDHLRGVATIRARATQNLSSFNLDLDGLRVDSVAVRGNRARWTRGRGELTVRPRHLIRKGHAFTTVVRYSGVPRTLREFGGSGFVHTDDGALVAGEPHSASLWYPNNDHPIDKASYTFHVTVPRGLTAVANGRLVRRRNHSGFTTWTWRAAAPMASYLSTVDIGDFDLHAHRSNGLPTWDAIDRSLYRPFATPRTGDQLAISGRADSSYKRLSRRIDVPAGGGELSFRMLRSTETDWDFAFVEAHPVGSRRWTTLPDANGHTSGYTGFSCPGWFQLHPFLRHYQSRTKGGNCEPTGTTGRWRAATGNSKGWERWTVDLSRYAGRSVQVSISYASDDVFQFAGLFVDDVVVSTGAGTTSFENDADPLDGWTVPGPPRGSGPNETDWVAGTVADEPPPPGRVARRAFAHQGEFLRFLSRRFGPYPFGVTGGIVDDVPRLQISLETQTRPVYGSAFFDSRTGGGPEDGELTVVHELSHQWFGDSLTVRRWRHIWLNEGFATYVEWLWTEHEGGPTTRQQFNGLYTGIPASASSFWDVTIGDPGPAAQLDISIYWRGAMTLQRLRQRVGDRDFFATLRHWTRAQAGGHVTTQEFVRLAERVSGRDLDRLFRVWLFTPGKPDLSPAAAGDLPSGRSALPAATAGLLKRLHRTGQLDSGTTPSR